MFFLLNLPALALGTARQQDLCSFFDSSPLWGPRDGKGLCTITVQFQLLSITCWVRIRPIPRSDTRRRP